MLVLLISLACFTVGYADSDDLLIRCASSDLPISPTSSVFIHICANYLNSDSVSVRILTPKVPNHPVRAPWR